ncbi:MAG TPA: arsenite methyltransferase [Candidatus Methanoperedens sp.]|nr:arsenite methyltransferase [Candidatus Methanoperedens sp.]
MKQEEIKKMVRERYASVAREGGSCFSPASSCCTSATLAEDISRRIGYGDEELTCVPEGANLGLGCGNPLALASLKEGEIVLDLGSGAGFDCFLAAKRVGKEGKVIGVDMTPDMIDRARNNARKGNYANVEFRLGEIENIPAADNSVDIVISNCVINLAPDKIGVFKEAFRVLKPGGRLMVSDIVLLKELPDFVRDSIEAYTGCVAGATKKDEYLNTIKNVGFKEVQVLDETNYPLDFLENDPIGKQVVEKLNMPIENMKEIGKSVVSIKVQAKK